MLRRLFGLSKCSTLFGKPESSSTRDESNQGESMSGEKGLSMMTVLPSPSYSSSESKALYQKNEVLVNRDMNNSARELTGKYAQYAKYAGEPPDGGLKAWSVVLGIFFTTCATFGYVNAWGVFQSYYEEVMLPNDSPSTIAWIGSVQYGLTFLPGLVTGRLFDIGYFKIPYFFASCLLVVCTFLVAECKVYWQFFLAQGLGTGIACGILYGPAPGLLAHWFSKRRALALTITAVGTSVGSTTFPIAAQNLIPEVGFKWTARIFGFILFLLLGTANLARQIVLDRRLPPQNLKGGMFNWVALKNPAYVVYCISGLTTYLGLFTALTYMPVSAIRVGVQSNFAFYLIAIANGSSAFVRVPSGILADRIGAINVMTPYLVSASVMTFVWPFATSKGALIAIAVIYGLSFGTYVSLIAAPVMAMGPVGDAGRRTGMYLTISAFGAVAGPPISGTINSSTGGFHAVGWYAGSILLFSVFLLQLTRYLHFGKLLSRF